MFKYLLDKILGSFRAIRILRFRAFDTSTMDGRANERHRLAAIAMIAAMLAKLISIGTALISVPLTLHYLGPEQYGMWMAMSSLVAMLNFADFGIGNGIMNAVSTAYGSDHKRAIQEYVSSGFVALSAIAVSIIAIFTISYPFVLWFKVFNVASESAQQDVAPTLAVLVFCFALAIPLGVVQRVQMGMQRGFVASLWQCGSSLLGLVGVIAAIAFQARLPILILAYVGSPLIAAVLNNIVFFGWQQPQLAPVRRAVSKEAIDQIAHTGLLFLALQFIGAVLFTSDNFLIVQLLGPADVTAYAVPQRLFSIIPVLLSMALSPLWPAYGEAIARGDHTWVWRTLKRSFFMAIAVSVPLSVFLIFSGSWLIDKWVGQAVAVSIWLLVGLGVWQVVQGGGAAISMYLNGANVVRFQIITGAAAAALAISLKIYFVPIIGIPGIIWCTIVSYILCVAVPLYYFLRSRLNMI